MTTLYASLVGELVDLGKLSAQEIADQFAAEDVRGYRYSAWQCPLAVALSQRLDNHVRVGAASAVIEVNIAQLPASVCEFITNFDKGAYPALEVGP